MDSVGRLVLAVFLSGIIGWLVGRNGVYSDVKLAWSAGYSASYDHPSAEELLHPETSRTLRIHRACNPYVRSNWSYGQCKKEMIDLHEWP